MSKLPYVIFVGPSLPVSYLTFASEEPDGGEPTGPTRTADPALAIQFPEFTAARSALRDAVKRYPAYSFRLDVLRSAA